MYTFTVMVKEPKQEKSYSAYDATILPDGSDFVVRVSVMESGIPKRYYFPLSQCEIVFRKNI